MSSIVLSLSDILAGYKDSIKGKRALQKYGCWFPIRQSGRLAGIIADLMGDGHLQGAPRWRIDYTSKTEEELHRFNDEIFKLFGIKGKIRPCNSNKYNTKNLGINNKPLARCLKMMGVPAGSKVSQPFEIPRWILEDRECFSRFINRLFCCEASVDVRYRCIDICMYKQIIFMQDHLKFFQDIRFYLLHHFDIKSTDTFPKGINKVFDGRCTVGLRFKIKNVYSLQQYHDCIGFDDVCKHDRLLQILNST